MWRRSRGGRTQQQHGKRSPASLQVKGHFGPRAVQEVEAEGADEGRLREGNTAQAARMTVCEQGGTAAPPRSVGRAAPQSHARRSERAEQKSCRPPHFRRQAAQLDAQRTASLDVRHLRGQQCGRPKRTTGGLTSKPRQMHEGQQPSMPLDARPLPSALCCQTNSLFGHLHVFPGPQPQPHRAPTCTLPPATRSVTSGRPAQRSSSSTTRLSRR